MRLVPAKDYAHSDQFPLELAMKIFWEADTINMTASVTTNNNTGGSDRIVTGTCNKTIKWGSYNDQTNGNLGPLANLREKVETAAEMLCYISDEWDKLPFSAYFGPTHTAYRENFDQGFKPWVNPQSPPCIVDPESCKWKTLETVVISPRAYYNEEQTTKPKTLYAPFFFGLENTGIVSLYNGINVSILNPNRPLQGVNSKLVGQADVITPWGSCKVDLAGASSVTDASMTITATAADPAVRYAKPRL